jgi:hypothetical protein
MPDSKRATESHVWLAAADSRLQSNHGQPVSQVDHNGFGLEIKIKKRDLSGVARSFNEKVTVRVEAGKPHGTRAGGHELLPEMAADDLKKLEAARAEVSASIQRVGDRVARVIADKETG